MVQETAEIAGELLTISGHWDPEAEVWTATSPQVPGLVLEAETWPEIMLEAALLAPELLKVTH